MSQTPASHQQHPQQHPNSSLYHLLYPNHMITKEEDQYLHELLHYSSTRVEKEPHYLQQSYHKVVTDINTLARTNYHVFVQSNTSLHNTIQASEKMKYLTTQMIHTLPDIQKN